MIEAEARERLLNLARIYCKATRLTLGQASAKLYGHRDFLPKFRKGQVSITLRKYDELEMAFHKYWPENVAWPTDI
jgi:hypothetical protein